ncbi:MAG: hypothetical protein ACYDC9_13620 [Dermatophilaceae bacterium]
MSRSNDERLEDILSAIARIDQIWATHNEIARVITTRLDPLRYAVQRLQDPTG